MMNPEIKTKWLEALRSGKYPQSRFRLRTPEGYCCLGVLCEVMEIPSKYDRDAETYTYTDAHGFGERDVLTPHIRKMAGLQPVHSDIITALMHKNDDDEWSFLRIADYIEKNL